MTLTFPSGLSACVFRTFRGVATSCIRSEEFPSEGGRLRFFTGDLKLDIEAASYRVSISVRSLIDARLVDFLDLVNADPRFELSGFSMLVLLDEAIDEAK